MWDSQQMGMSWKSNNSSSNSEHPLLLLWVSFYLEKKRGQCTVKPTAPIRRISSISAATVLQRIYCVGWKIFLKSKIVPYMLRVAATFFPNKNLQNSGEIRAAPMCCSRLCISQRGRHSLWNKQNLFSMAQWRTNLMFPVESQFKENGHLLEEKFDSIFIYMDSTNWTLCKWEVKS